MIPPHPPTTAATETHYVNTDSNNLFSLSEQPIFIIVPAFFVCLLVTMVIVVWVFVRRHKFPPHRREKLVQSSSLPAGSSYDANVQLWLSKQPRSGTVDWSGPHSWPVAGSRSAAERGERLSVVSYSVVYSGGEFLQRLEDRVTGECRLYRQNHSVCSDAGHSSP